MVYTCCVSTYEDTNGPETIYPECRTSHYTLEWPFFYTRVTTTSPSISTTQDEAISYRNENNTNKISPKHSINLELNIKVSNLVSKY
jgi:hypothetical protein